MAIPLSLAPDKFRKREVTRMRAFLAVLGGYVIFAGSAVFLFQVTKVDPHSPAAAGFELLTIVYGIGFASLGGFVTGTIARRADLSCGIALALVIALGATVSIVARPGAGALWTQTAALLLFAPAALAGDWIRRRTRRRTA
jgi:cation transport ATPase